MSHNPGIGIINAAQKNKNMLHKKVRRFSTTGEFVTDSQIPQLREFMEENLTQQARDRGYVPLLDLEPDWSTWYDIENDKWQFRSTVYVVFIGKRKAKEWVGFGSGKLLPHVSQSIKSEQS